MAIRFPRPPWLPLWGSWRRSRLRGQKSPSPPPAPLPKGEARLSKNRVIASQCSHWRGNPPDFQTFSSLNHRFLRSTGGFPHQSADWFGMTTYLSDFFDTLTSPKGRGKALIRHGEAVPPSPKGRLKKRAANGRPQILFGFRRAYPTCCHRR